MKLICIRCSRLCSDSTHGKSTRRICDLLWNGILTMIISICLNSVKSNGFMTTLTMGMGRRACGTMRSLHQLTRGRRKSWTKSRRNRQNACKLSSSTMIKVSLISYAVRQSWSRVQKLSLINSKMIWAEQETTIVCQTWFSDAEPSETSLRLQQLGMLRSVAPSSETKSSSSARSSNLKSKLKRITAANSTTKWKQRRTCTDQMSLRRWPRKKNDWTKWQSRLFKTLTTHHQRCP